MKEWHGRPARESTRKMRVSETSGGGFGKAKVARASRP
jgi:hypothetical protein